jgi:uncharacterized protein YkwD
MVRFNLKAGLLMAAVVLLQVGLGQQAHASVADDVIQLVNQARSQGRVCGNQRFGPTGPLYQNSRLTYAAQHHSSDQAARRSISHTGSDGSTIGQRITRSGYEWQSVRENVAKGQRTSREVVNDWLDSPGHCKNMMDPAVNEAGADAVRGADGLFYWTMTFGRR